MFGEGFPDQHSQAVQFLRSDGRGGGLVEVVLESADDFVGELVDSL
jgi:hypothetical protein